jgi:hypothetical protein
MGCKNVPSNNRQHCERCLARDKGYKDKRGTRLKEAETPNAIAAGNESQVRRWSTPFDMRIFKTLLGLFGHGVVRILTAAQLSNNPRVRQIQPRAQNIKKSPPKCSINCCGSHMNGTTLGLARSLDRREGMAALKIVSVYCRQE